MSLLGTCFKFPPIQGCTLYFYREFQCYAPSTQTFAYGRVPSSLGITAASDGSTSGVYSKASGTDWDGNPASFTLSFPESIPGGEDTIYTAGGETEGWFYYNPGSSPNPDGNNCCTGVTYSNEFPLWNFIDDITANFPGGSFTGLTAGLAREYNFHDNDVNCGAVQLSTVDYSALDGSLFLYASPFAADGAIAYCGCAGFDGSNGCTSQDWVPAKLAVTSGDPCTGLPYFVPGIAASFAAFTSIRPARTGRGYGLIFAIGRALAINDIYVLVTWVMMADGNTFIRPTCSEFSNPGGADVVIPCPDLKSLDSVAGDLYPLNASTTALSAQPIGLLTKILVGYDCASWTAAGKPF